MSIDYNMNSLIVDEDTYYIRNIELEKYVQIDNNDSGNNYNSQGAILELWDWRGHDIQKWIFEYLHNGYYAIKSYKSNLVISVDEEDVDSSGHALIQETYNGSHRQQWKITVSSQGNYIIKARSSERYSPNRVMCAGDGIGTNGRNVEQRTYENNMSYKDEWIVEKARYDTCLLAYNEAPHIKRNEYFIETQNKLREVRRNDFLTLYYETCSIQSMLYYMSSCSLYVVHTHGSQTSISLGERLLTMNDLAAYDLSNIQIAVLLTCSAGVGGYDQSRVNAKTPINIVEQLVCCCADTVIGFSSITYVADCNKFVVDLFTLVVDRNVSLNDAIDIMKNEPDKYIYTFAKNMPALAVIGGNQNKYI